VSIVQNATRDWGRVDVTVNVANDIDIERAVSVIADVADQLSRDPNWSAAILEPPRVLGIDAFSHAGVAIRVWIVTLPPQRVPVRREFNRRVLVALREHGIEMGVPQQIVRPVKSGGKTAAGPPAGDTEEGISLATPKATGSSR
jgi:small conductance mechanosensitive channel